MSKGNPQTSRTLLSPCVGPKCHAEVIEWIPEYMQVQFLIQCELVKPDTVGAAWQFMMCFGELLVCLYFGARHTARTDAPAEISTCATRTLETLRQHQKATS